MADMLSAKNVLIVCTSASEWSPGNATGAWMEEIAGPYYTFSDAGCKVQLCSIKGGKVPIDQGSLSDNFQTDDTRKFLGGSDKALLDKTPSLESILSSGLASKYECIFLAGGHGTIADFTDASLTKAVTEMYAAGKVVAAVCHGPIGLEAATKPNGEALVKGLKVTGFSNVEEGQVGLTEKIKAAGFHTPEDGLTELGGIYSCGDAWTAHAVADGKVVTGQNPQSSVACAAKCLNAMV